jgi:hypothetical protein
MFSITDVRRRRRIFRFGGVPVLNTLLARLMNRPSTRVMMVPMLAKLPRYAVPNIAQKWRWCPVQAGHREAALKPMSILAYQP